MRSKSFPATLFFNGNVRCKQKLFTAREETLEENNDPPALRHTQWGDIIRWCRLCVWEPSPNTTPWSHSSPPYPPAAKPQATHTPIDGEPSRPSRAGEEISDNHLHPWPMDHLVESQMPPGDPDIGILHATEALQFHHPSEHRVKRQPRR